MDSLDSKIHTINLEQTPGTKIVPYDLVSFSLGHKLIIKYNFKNNPYLLKFQASSTTKSLLVIKALRNDEIKQLESIQIYPIERTCESIIYCQHQDQLILEIAQDTTISQIKTTLRKLSIVPIEGFEDLGLELEPGTRHFRAYVSKPAKYDLHGSNQFCLLTQLGMREYKYILDIGCGSLNLGRLLIPFLLPHRYFAVEPNKWLVEEGIKHHLGNDIMKLKNPRFLYVDNFAFDNFDQKFDFLIANSIFSHAFPKQIEQCLMKAKKVMHNDSIFVASFMKGVTNLFENYWCYPGLWQYTVQHIHDMVLKSGLYCKELQWSYPGVQTWFAISKSQDGLEDINI